MSHPERVDGTGAERIILRMPPIQAATCGPLAVHGLGMVVLDEQVFLREYPAADAKVFAEGHRLQIGGPVPTALAQLRKLGAECRFLGAWGDDPAGREIEADFDRTGIGFDRAACRVADHTGFAHVWVEPATGRRTVVSVPPAQVPDRDGAAAFGRAADVLHLDGWGGDAAISAAEATHASGGLVTLDAGSIKPATERLIPLARVLNAPMRFIRSYCGTDDPLAGARRLLELGPELVTVTDGERGAGVYTAQVAEWLPAFPAEAVDTCGAGDVFCGGLLFAFLNGENPASCLRFAMAAAALKVTRLGNRDALPDRDAVEVFLSRFG